MDKPRTMKWKGLTLTEYAPGAYVAEHTGKPVVTAEVWFDSKTYCAAVKLAMDDPDAETWQALGATPKRALTNAARKGLAFHEEAVRKAVSFLRQRA